MPKTRKSKSLWGRLTAYFLTGVFALLPLAITVAIVAWVAAKIHYFVGPDAWLGRRLAGIGMEISEDSPWVGDSGYLLGWIVVLAALFGLGFLLVELGIKRFVGRLVDALVSRIPLIGQVYGTSKQMVDMLDQGDSDKLKGMAPVFCYFGEGRNGGALALLVSPESYKINGREYQIVIIPTAPVPFGGGLLFMPVEQIEPAGMSVDGLMSIYISMGVTAPQFLETTGDKK